MQLKDLWKRLNEFFQPIPKPTEEFYNTWRSEMQKHALQDVEAMITHVERHNNRMPPLNDMLLITDSIKQNREAAEWQRAKQREAVEAGAFWAGTKTDNYGKQALRLIQGMLEGEMTRGQYLAGMREMDMPEEADDLEDFYARHDYVLNERPQGRQWNTEQLT